MMARWRRMTSSLDFSDFASESKTDLKPNTEAGAHQWRLADISDCKKHATLLKRDIALTQYHAISRLRLCNDTDNHPNEFT
jgi:hypothetical protein